MAGGMVWPIRGLRICGIGEVRLGSGNATQERRRNLLVCKAQSSSDSQSKQADRKILRRGTVALGLFAAENLLSEILASRNLAGAHAVEESLKTSTGSSDASKQADEGNATGSPVDALLSLFDPNEKTKSGKLLPKNYLKSARNVIKSLKESLKEESGKETDVRKSADQAKEAIRDYLSNWRGQKTVQSEESYKALEVVFKILGKFYAKQGPRAILPLDVKSELLKNLEVADAAL